METCLFSVSKGNFVPKGKTLGTKLWPKDFWFNMALHSLFAGASFLILSPQGICQLPLRSLVSFEEKEERKPRIGESGTPQAAPLIWTEPYSGATCTVCNKRTNNGTILPTLKKQCSCRLSGSSENRAFEKYRSIAYSTPLDSVQFH